MYTNQIENPLAWAILDKNDVAFCNCTTKEMVAFLELLSIPAFYNILISKHDSYIELFIMVKKVANLHERIRNVEKLYTILEYIDGVQFEYISNTTRHYKDYYSLTVLCSLNAINL